MNNIPIEKTNKSKKMVLDLETNTFTWIQIDGKPKPVRVPEPPFVADIEKVNSVLTELQLSGNYKTYFYNTYNKLLFNL